MQRWSREPSAQEALTNLHFNFSAPSFRELPASSPRSSHTSAHPGQRWEPGKGRPASKAGGFPLRVSPLLFSRSGECGSPNLTVGRDTGAGPSPLFPSRSPRAEVKAGDRLRKRGCIPAPPPLPPPPVLRLGKAVLPVSDRISLPNTVGRKTAESSSSSKARYLSPPIASIYGDQAAGRSAVYCLNKSSSAQGSE